MTLEIQSKYILKRDHMDLQNWLKLLRERLTGHRNSLRWLITTSMITETLDFSLYSEVDTLEKSFLISNNIPWGGKQYILNFGK